MYHQPHAPGSTSAARSTPPKPRRVRRFRLGWAAVFGLLTAGVTWLVLAAPASACGGFFCQTDPVDQAAERILFTVNDDNTVSSLIEIEYQGSAADFSWILPIPEAIEVDDVQVPNEGDLVFDELHRQTDVQVFAPNRNAECLPQPDFEDTAAGGFDEAMEEDASEGVEIFGSGEVGPFGFDIIGSEDPAALITWLRDNDYQVTASMEPLVQAYVDEEFAFIAMRLLDGEDSDSITPVEITYPGSTPMIPLRLTAVAAFPQMPIFVWILAEEQAVPENFEHFEVDTREITFNRFGAGDDYRLLVSARADAVGGRGFITEYAGAVEEANIANNYVLRQAENAPYLTRLMTVIDPEEMTIDPMFGFDGSAEDVSNIRDARNLRGVYDCERSEARNGQSQIDASDAIDPNFVNQEIQAGTFVSFNDLPEDAYLQSYIAESFEIGDLADPDNGDLGDEPDDDSDDDNNEQAVEISERSSDGFNAAWLLLPMTIILLGAVGAAAYFFGRTRTAEAQANRNQNSGPRQS